MLVGEPNVNILLLQLVGEWASSVICASGRKRGAGDEREREGGKEGEREGVSMCVCVCVYNMSIM